MYLWKRFNELLVTRTLRMAEGAKLKRPKQDIIIPVGTGQSKVGGTAGWAVAAADNVALATLPASQTGSKLVVPIPQLKVGDKITGFWLLGQIESAGGAVTLDADLRKQTAAAADVTDASVATMTQISVTADTKVDQANSFKGSLEEVVAQDESFYMVLTGTTALATDIALMAIGLRVNEDEV